VTEARKSEIIAQIERLGVEAIHLQFTDIPGAIKSVTIPARRVRACLADGVWFDGSAVEGAARLVECDLYLRPDLATFAVLPWEQPPAARLICDLVLPDGSPFGADPRAALRAVLAEAAEAGLGYRVSGEVEFFLFEEQEGQLLNGQPPAPIDRRGYFEAGSSRAAKLCEAISQALAAFRVDVVMAHHEVAPGQHEVDLGELGALEAADALVTVKWALRASARREGLMASFMPKPLEEASGSGLHLHQLLVERASGANALVDPADDYRLSATGRHFIAGQLAHARGMCAVLAPLVNSYKRLTGGREAPAQVTWARSNRGAFIRVPEPRSLPGMRVELRAADPSCNPYLALAVMLKAGLDGIANQLSLPPPREEPGQPGARQRPGDEGGDPLPGSLDEALEELDWDPVVRAALGQPIFERFLAAKAEEWLAYRRHISQWELQRYLLGA